MNKMFVHKWIKNPVWYSGQKLDTFRMRMRFRGEMDDCLYNLSLALKWGSHGLQLMIAGRWSDSKVMLTSMLKAFRSCIKHLQKFLLRKSNG